MTNTNITSFRKDIYNLLEQTIKYNEPINISTKNGNAVVLSEEDYNSIMETLYITSIPNLKDEIINRVNDDDDEYVDESEVEWYTKNDLIDSLHEKFNFNTAYEITKKQKMKKNF